MRKRSPGPRRPTEGANRLFDFLERNQISYAAAALAFRVSRVTVYAWATGQKRPSEDHRVALEIWTKGDVPRDAWRTSSETPPPIAPFEPAHVAVPPAAESGVLRPEDIDEASCE